MNEGPTGGWRRLIWRAVPPTLGGRLVVTVLLLAVAVSVVTIVLDTAIVRAQIGAAGFSPPLVTITLVSTGAAALVAATAAALLGLWLAHLARGPVERMVEDVETAGARVLDGEEHAGTLVTPDALLPQELNDVATVLDGVLSRLAQRQAELREAVAKAESAEETLGAVVSGSLDSEILVEDGVVVLANPAAALALGTSPEALRGSTIAEALAGATVREDDGALADPSSVIDRALEGPVTIHLERDGTGPTSYVVRATRPTESDPGRVLVTGRHVTEELRTQRIRSEIVEIVSHDLRAPLAVVNGYLDVLRRPLSDEERDRVLDAAKRDAARMSTLLEDLLSAAKAEELLAPAELAPVSLADIAGEVVVSMKAAHPGRELHLEADGPSPVLGDEVRLRQALVNLVTNALRYSPRDRSVTVAVSSADSRVSLSVVDHGPGVPEAHRDLVFERYARLDAAPGARPGLGLGLYIVRVIAENHGGRARVAETPGGGATFVIDLPVAAAGAGPAAPCESPSA